MTDLNYCIELRSGGFLNLLNPDPADITLDDVAHGLSMTCRFGGQSSRFYSVAEHTMLVAMYLIHRGFSHAVALEGLHHDDSEAFITDVPRPAKPLLKQYTDLEKTIQEACMAAFDVQSLNHAAVKDADNWALAQEAHELMPSKGKCWDFPHPWDGRPRMLGLKPDLAKKTWLQLHDQLSI